MAIEFEPEEMSTAMVNLQEVSEELDSMEGGEEMQDKVDQARSAISKFLVIAGTDGE